MHCCHFDRHCQHQRFGVARTCYLHKCADANCVEPKQTAGQPPTIFGNLYPIWTTGQFCEKHTCTVFACQEKKGRDQLCAAHTCLVRNCKGQASTEFPGIGLCSEHRCKIEDCSQKRAAGYFCQQHTCRKTDCKEQAKTEGRGAGYCPCHYRKRRKRRNAGGWGGMAAGPYGNENVGGSDSSDSDDGAGFGYPHLVW
ncbi:uncharacterized protein BCR38DRAFT_443842 [Pseudomassariella vexata]|uniref:Uncharacterized protein n=1 Tax=Pseudomassariella vexata TaxID=1141098 RepID=A0A1Y2DLP1_9PEZI|nr:uncharacterized protein BCR38DRAFT_443842 [Pseudomassariella vexata]ORY60074.1 hypothetical protein BCR38DRAFT_443842 [Pseudomassariella vexata]